MGARSTLQCKLIEQGVRPVQDFRLSAVTNEHKLSYLEPTT